MLPRGLLSVEVDQGGGYAVNAQIKATGIDIETGAFISAINKDTSGEVISVSVADSTSDEAVIHQIDADLVVFAAGIRPNDELARAAGLETGERGGILVNNACHTSDEHIWAIGEVACVLGRTWGLVAPPTRWRMRSPRICSTATKMLRSKNSISPRNSNSQAYRLQASVTAAAPRKAASKFSSQTPRAACTRRS